MARNMCAVVRMEEMYLRLTIEYDNDISRKQIAEAILKVEKETQSFPSVIRRAISPEAGNFSVEFCVECENREAGEFFERVMKELNITSCD